MTHHADLKGKVALVTGAGSGIGKEAAMCFADHGAKVALIGRDQEQLNAAAKEVQQKVQGSQVLALKADVGHEHEIKHAIDEAAKNLGGLDIVVANASIFGVWSPIDQLTTAEYDEVTRINLRGTFLTIKFAVPHLKQRGGGSIVVVSDIIGTRSFNAAGSTAYAVTKAGQVALTKMLAVELGQHKIRINALVPGRTTDTDLESSRELRAHETAGHKVEYPKGDIPLGTAAKPSDIVKSICFLAGPDSSLITGTELFHDGGQSLVR